jgi:lipoprotein-anchoring transpeptidase ErfK/SrfK
VRRAVGPLAVSPALALAVAVAAALAATGCGDDASAPTSSTAAARPTPTSATPVPRRAAADAVQPAGDPAARIVRPTVLRASPGGRVVARVSTRTEFGSPRYLPVARRRGAWLGVIAAERPNGRLGWIPASATSTAVAPVRVLVDLAARRLRVVQGRRTLLRMPVGIGGPATPTPTGTFAVTDGLRGARGSPYGCCILALSGHQPDVPQGWTGGDRLAIHGTNDAASIGGASSSGCLRAGDADLRRLLRVARLGAIVEISDGARPDR